MQHAENSKNRYLRFITLTILYHRWILEVIIPCLRYGASCMRFLVIEDNPKLSAQLRWALEEQGYIVDVASNGHEGEEKAAIGGYDGILLDVMLPHHDGIEICKNLRRLKVATPILMLTALSDTEHKVAGLEAGADDYLTKPFDLEELIARVRALLRRAHPEEGSILRFEDIELDLNKRSVKRADKPITLTSKEFALLEYFMRNPNRVASRSILGERVWDLAFQEESNVIEVYVSRLRNKIDRGFDKALIHTVIGTGYILSADGPPA
jgi:two-component system copper resistance phosphate regulon response regulator CusR